jgi:hydroxymethylpyrimidine/phosphomethylpyrimidine kinase
MIKVLTIAGSDSGGGAGIQADIKTIYALGAYPLTVISALTAQNSLGVDSILKVAPDFVVAQMDSVISDMSPHATKTGMLLNAGILKAVVRTVERYRLPLLVVDPVILSSTGKVLLESNALTIMREQLLPLATVVTPNLHEAGVLSGKKVSNIDEMKAAARRIKEFGPANVVITGGHLKKECVDILYDGKEVYRFGGPQIESEHTHGSGCVFSAALATFLAMGNGVIKGAEMANDFTRKAISKGSKAGKGPGSVQPPL